MVANPKTKPSATSPSTTIPSGQVQCPGLWTRDEIGDSWIYSLADDEIAEIDAALKHAESALGAPFEDVERIDLPHFPLPRFQSRLAAFLDELEGGRGFVVIRGLPVTRYSEQQVAAIFWGLSHYLGAQVSINAYGERLGHVRDLGLDAGDTNVRNYQTREALNYHNDKCDVIGLLCLQPAKHGGASSVASAAAIHNAMATRRPDLLAELYRPMAIDRRGEPGGQDGTDQRGYYVLPVFNWHRDNLTTRYSVRAYYDSAMRFPDAPRLSEKRGEALDLVQTIANEPKHHVDFMLQPGDMQFMNNYAVLHARTAFSDHAELEKRRHLLRIWLSVKNSRELPDYFSAAYGATAAGSVRGGVYVSKPKEAAPRI